MYLKYMVFQLFIWITVEIKDKNEITLFRNKTFLKSI